ncbi:DNA mismatch repair endonuclease MutL [ANME-1 cluster archaeon GoMg4]|nr:DNA mismatch repair endonuclease MutL [ANME-1 cluster archaeon GoMg4]
MRCIFVLEEQTIGKIAAGEVVDRPASVVKELIENSIDAGSSRMVVEVGNGGRDYIRITDDGCGISEGDVTVAFEKHATSKIKRIEDLTALRTLGFRGEALPSIAAVSRIELSTRHESEDFGTYLKVEGGEIKERRRITRGIGTTVEVKSLFYNLPARIGTLKSKSTELRHIVDVCINYAVIYPEIKFELVHDDSPIMSTVGTGKMLDAIVNTYGSGVAKELIELKAPDSPQHQHVATISGYISKPVVSYGTKKHLFTYVNRRFVRSEVVEKAIKRGYGSLLPKHAYPFAVISLSIDPREINVNIHPKKHEIRFYHANDVFQFIADAVSTTLRHADLIPEVVQREEGIEAGAVDFFGLPMPKEERAAISVQTSIQGDLKAEEFTEKRGRGGGLDIRAAPLYQVLDSYIIAQSEEDDVIMIDQHAAAERVNYEKLIARYGGRIDKQTLLRPYMPELSPHQLYLLRENENVLREMGFDIERLGDDSYIIRAIPVVFHGMIGEDELIEVMTQLVEERGKREDQIKVLFSTAACRASIKAGEKLSYEDMREIVERLKIAKIPFTCPHGRPTMIRLSKKEIEKRFKRR